LSKRAAADPNAAMRRSVPNPLSSLARIAMSRVRAGHLNSERGLDFISWCGRRNHRERGVQRSFRNRAERRTSRSLKLEQRVVYKVARHRAKGCVEPIPPVFVLAVRRMRLSHIGIRPPQLYPDWWKATGSASRWSVKVTLALLTRGSDATEWEHATGTSASWLCIATKKNPKQSTRRGS
jgi:hypothetical protein